MMQYRYTLHEEENAYDGFFKLSRYRVSFECFGGGFIENAYRECGRKGDIVSVLPYDPKTETFLFVEQFRIGMAARNEPAWTLEVVAGFMDVVGETPIETAHRELLEETGCHAEAMHPLMTYYPGPGGSATQNHVFIAIVNSDQAAKHTGIIAEGEDICVHKLSLSAVRQQLGGKMLNNSTTLIALQQFFLHDWQEKLAKNQVLSE